ncbi:unnamed protein product, partial [marine sediment metagenome]
ISAITLSVKDEDSVLSPINTYLSWELVGSANTNVTTSSESISPFLVDSYMSLGNITLILTDTMYFGNDCHPDEPDPSAYPIADWRGLMFVAPGNKKITELKFDFTTNYDNQKVLAQVVDGAGNVLWEKDVHGVSIGAETLNLSPKDKVIFRLKIRHNYHNTDPWIFLADNIKAKFDTDPEPMVAIFSITGNGTWSDDTVEDKQKNIENGTAGIALKSTTLAGGATVQATVVGLAGTGFVNTTPDTPV